MFSVRLVYACILLLMFASCLFAGILLMFASLAFSYARPVEKLSPCRPITTIFHPAIWVSILGQLAIHLGGLMYIIHLTRQVPALGFRVLRGEGGLECYEVRGGWGMRGVDRG